jgi:hypothetical protein
VVLLVGVGGSNDFHVRATPSFRDKDVSAVSGGFGCPFDNFVAFDFMSIHHLRLDFVST